MATGPTDFPAFRTVTLDAPSEAPTIAVAQSNELLPFQTFGQYLGQPALPPAPTRLRVPQLRRRLDRRLGCGRPAVKRTSAASRAGPSDLADDDPPRKPLEARYEWRTWAAERCEALDRLIADDKRAPEARAPQLVLDIGVAA
jgi:hypothetical protein